MVLSKQKKFRFSHILHGFLAS